MSWQKGFPKYSSELSPSSVKAWTAGFVESCVRIIVTPLMSTSYSSGPENMLGYMATSGP
jgi:hypothetical protein